MHIYEKIKMGLSNREKQFREQNIIKPLQNPAEVRAEAWLGEQTKVLSESKLANIQQKATRETWFRKSADESVSGRHGVP